MASTHSSKREHRHRQSAYSYITSRTRLSHKFQHEPLCQLGTLFVNRQAATQTGIDIVEGIHGGSDELLEQILELEQTVM